MAKKRVFKEFTKEEAIDKMNLTYMESPLGYQFTIDNAFRDEEGDFCMVLPTGEVFYTEQIKK